MPNQPDLFALAPPPPRAVPAPAPIAPPIPPARPAQRPSPAAERLAGLSPAIVAAHDFEHLQNTLAGLRCAPQENTDG